MAKELYSTYHIRCNIITPTVYALILLDKVNPYLMVEYHGAFQTGRKGSSLRVCSRIQTELYFYFCMNGSSSFHSECQTYCAPCRHEHATASTQKAALLCPRIKITHITKTWQLCQIGRIWSADFRLFARHSIVLAFNYRLVARNTWAVSAFKAGRWHHYYELLCM